MWPIRQIAVMQQCNIITAADGAAEAASKAYAPCRRPHPWRVVAHLVSPKWVFVFATVAGMAALPCSLATHLWAWGGAQAAGGATRSIKATSSVVAKRMAAPTASREVQVRRTSALRLFKKNAYETCVIHYRLGCLGGINAFAATCTFVDALTRDQWEGPVSTCNLWSGMCPATDAIAFVTVLSFRNTMASNGYFACALYN